MGLIKSIAKAMYIITLTFLNSVNVPQPRALDNMFLSCLVKFIKNHKRIVFAMNFS